MSGTSDAARDRAKDQLERDPDYFRKLGSRGGKKSGNRTFRDPEKAKAAANKRWEGERRGA